MRNSNVAKTICGTEKAYDNDTEVGKTLVGGKFLIPRQEENKKECNKSIQCNE